MEKLKLTKRAFFSNKFDDYHNAKIYYTFSKQNTTTELATGIKETNNFGKKSSRLSKYNKTRK